jgi:hypothetical protein
MACKDPKEELIVFVLFPIGVSLLENMVNICR